jgi:plasmid stabilization system protein ParE
LFALVDTHWAEAADSIAAIESLADAGSELAAAVASKIYYHLEAYPEAVRLALAAGSLFDVDAKSEYVETIVGACATAAAHERLGRRGLQIHGQRGGQGSGAAPLTLLFPVWHPAGAVGRRSCHSHAPT